MLTAMFPVVLVKIKTKNKKQKSAGHMFDNYCVYDMCVCVCIHTHISKWILYISSNWEWAYDMIDDV